MTQHEHMTGVRVVEKYDMDTLGAPFRITLLDSVRVGVDPESGKEVVSVPDVVGLINAVVRARVQHTRKLNGPEIRFIRSSLGLTAKLLADFLEVTPEHFSRCEADTKALSPSSEKILRLFAFLGTFVKEPREILSKSFVEAGVSSTLPELSSKAQKMFDGFIRVFIGMKLQAFYDINDPLHFEFVRRSTAEHCGTDDDGEWIKDAA